jgi:YD repeat-containing protein
LSPVTVTNNTVTGMNNYGIWVEVRRIASLVEPVVEDNSVSTVNGTAVSVAAQRLAPSKLENNTATADTMQVLALAGTLVGDLTLPRPGLPMAIAHNTVVTPDGLTVDHGVTLTVNEGVVIKAYGTYSPLNVYGTLDVNGTAANPVTFTSIKDDTAGGDTNLDGNATTPTAGNWPGIRGYDATDEPMRILMDYAELRYAPLSVSATSGAETGVDPKQSEVSLTNSRFEHGSYVEATLLGPVSIAGNVVENGVGEFKSTGIYVSQYGLSETLSPVTVTGNTVSGMTHVGIKVDTSNSLSLVEPVVENNAVSMVGSDAVWVRANRLVPSKLENNTATADTMRIMSLGGTLVEDLTLPRPGLPVAIGRQYSGGLTVEVGVTFTIGEGVVIKAYTDNYSHLTVYGTLDVNGTAANPVIFTSVKDDTAGGDTNLDGNATTPAIGDWPGVRLLGDSAAMTASNVEVRYADTGVSASDGSSASLAGSTVRDNSRGLYSTGTSSVVFRGTIVDNDEGAVACSVPNPPATPSCTIDARDVDWGTDSGPFPFGTGDSVSGAVTVIPWVGFRETEFFYFGAGAGDYAGSSSGSWADYRRSGGDPVDMASGNFGTTFTDVSVPEPGPDLVFTRAYNSLSDDVGVLGEGWFHSWQTHVEDPASTPLGTLNLVWGDGRLEAFTPLGGGAYEAPAGSFTSVVDAAGGGWEATTKDRVVYSFNASGWLTDVVDSNGNSLAVTHDGSGNPTVVTDDAGRTLSLTYTDGLLASVTDPAGQIWGYGYTGGLLTSVTDPDGFATTYAYDGENRLTHVIDENGNADIVNIYDSNGRVVTQQDALGNMVRFSYSTTSRRTTKTDPEGGTRTYDFDEQRKLTAETDSLGFTTTYGYDTLGNRTSETDPLGGVTAATFDVEGNALTVTDPEGRTTTRTWANSLLSSETDARGHTTTHGYDGDRNLTSSTDALGNTTTYVHDARGLVLTATTPSGRVTTNTYNAQGDLATSTDGRGNTSSFAYNAMGRPSTVTNAAGGATTFTYDGRGNRLSETDPSGNTTAYAYDGVGNQISVTDPLGHTTTTTYLANDLASTVTDRTGAPTTYGYDRNGNRTSVTDPQGHTTSFSYDSDNRVVRTVTPNGSTETRTYDATDRVKTITDPGGHITRTSYDLTGLVLSVTDPSGGVTSYAYDAAGNRTSRTDGNGHTTTYAYDAANRLTGWVDPLGRAWGRGYDADGLVTTAGDPAGGTTTSGYDNAGNLTSITWPNASATAITYDALNRVTQRSESAGTTSWSYDANSNIVSTVDANGETITYAYDALDRVVTRSVTGSATTTYSYDAEGRLTAVNDAAGNLAYTYRSDGALTAASLPNSVALAVTYDADKRPTRYTYTDTVGAATVFDEQLVYDPAGNVTQITDPLGVRTFTYDALDQLTSEDTGNVAATWTYDAVGNRLTATRVTTTTAAEIATDTADIAAETAPEGSTDTPDETTAEDSTDSTEDTTETPDETTGATTEPPNETTAEDPANTVDPASDDAPTDATAESEKATTDNTTDETAVEGPTDSADATAETPDETTEATTDETPADTTEETIETTTVTYTYDNGDQLVSDTTGTAYTYNSLGNLTTVVNAGGTTTYTYNTRSHLTGITTPATTITRTVADSGTPLTTTIDGTTTSQLHDQLVHSGPALIENTTSGTTTRTLWGLTPYAQAGSTLLVDHLGSVRVDWDGATPTPYDYDAWGNPLPTRQPRPHLGRRNPTR